MNSQIKLKQPVDPNLDLSVILPVFNEEDNIVELNQEIVDVLDGLDLNSEIIYVDDGSSDSTLEKLKSLHQSDTRISVVEFRRNFGQTAAMSAGFDLAKGRVIVSMDADRQNDPADIPKLLDKINEGYDLVAGWRFDRRSHRIVQGFARTSLHPRLYADAALRGLSLQTTIL